MKERKCYLFKGKAFDPSCLYFQFGFIVVEISRDKLFLIKKKEHYLARSIFNLWCCTEGVLN